LYPETAKNVNNSQINTMVHIHYPNSKVFTEHTYLIITYVFLLMYIYFSVSKYLYLLITYIFLLVYIYFSVSKYSGASLIRTPLIRMLHYPDDISGEQTV
jgi:hypothetical protein